MLRKPGALIAVGIAGAMLAGCGSSSLDRPATKTVPARQTPLASNPDVGGTSQQSSQPAAALGQLPSHNAHARASAEKSHISTAKVTKARETPTTSNDDKTTTASKPPNPCRLVSLSEAHTITGGAITKMTEAPLGPTCIYSGGRHAPGITLAVEADRLSQIAPHLRASTHMVIAGHRSVCGRLGTQMLLVPLGHYQLLNVTAPCGVAQRFATVAVGRLSA